MPHMSQVTDEPTRQITPRVQPSLVEAAHRAARQVYPDASVSGTVRLALARLAGLPDEYGADLPRAPRTRGRRTKVA
jgi:hypothetical protein